MDPIRILHKHWPGYGWSYTSPDVPGMTGGESTYDESVKQAEIGVRFTLECEAEESGRPAPDLSGLEFDHYRSEAANTTAPAPLAA